MRATGTILIVDDDDILLQNCQTWFEQGLYKIHTALSGEQALEILSKKTIDVMIADYVLPGINGIELIEEALKIRPNLPTLVFTGHGDLPSAKKAIKLGVKDYVEKKEVWKDNDEVVFLSKDMQTDFATLQKRVDELIVQSFRYQIVSAMQAALRLWEIMMREKEKYVSQYVFKASFAESSGIWKVQEEAGVMRTRGLDRYLEMSKLPKRPRKDLVLRSLWFVLDRCQSVQKDLWEDLKNKTEKLEKLFGS